MGNKVSKAGSTGRVLAANIKNKNPSTQHTRISSNAVPDAEDRDVKVANRLKQLGQVQFKTEEMNYKPASEDKFTITLEARQRIEGESADVLEKGGLKTLIPPQTITAILSSLKEGDDPEWVIKTYNLDKSILPKLANLSLPEFARSNVNELLDQAPKKTA